MSDQSNSIDIRALLSLYASGGAPKAALDHFAARQNNSARTTVDRLQALLRAEGHDVSRSDIIELFRGLEAAHCGQFRIGRKGHPSRFEWSVGLTSAGQAASGETTTVEALSEAETEALDDVESSAEMLDHRFHLRPDLEITIQLPSNLSLAEASRVADFVRTIPFASSARWQGSNSSGRFR